MQRFYELDKKLGGTLPFPLAVTLPMGEKVDTFQWEVMFLAVFNLGLQPLHMDSEKRTIAQFFILTPLAVVLRFPLNNA